MAATESSMTLSPASTETPKNPVLIGDSSANTEDAGALFAALMRESALRPANSEGSEVDSADAQTGKGLPGLPPRFAVRGYSPEPIVTDSKLEEFAVTMGIDRSLARLLLSETTNDSVVTEQIVAETYVAPVDSISTDTKLERPTVEPTVVAIPPSLLPPPVLPPPAPPISVAGEAAARTMQEGAASGASITPIADEDLLRWRAFGFGGLTEAATSDAFSVTTMPATKVTVAADEAIPGMQQNLPSPWLRASEPRTGAPMVEESAAESSSPESPAVETATLSTGAQIKKDLGIGRLLTLTTPARGASILVEPGDTAGSSSVQNTTPLTMASVLTLMSTDESRTRENPRATTTVSELRSRAFNVSDIESADREPDAFTQEGETPSDSDRWDMQSFVSALAPRSLDARFEMTSATGGPLAGPAVTPPSAELAASLVAAVIGPEAMTELPSGFRDLSTASTTPLPLPDPKMTAEDRSRTFAEAVAQRVIGQIRNENWSVNLQLEPLNMGSMDINLSLRGTEVTATLGVANAEVRTLLEAGLPRLRESLESSGLQLAGWSFGHSGQRARSDSSPMPYVAQVYRERASEADIVTDAASVAVYRRGSESSHAVDLFV